MPSKHPKITLLVTPEQDAWLDSQTGPLKTKSVVIRDLIDTARQGLTGVGTLTERREETPGQGGAFLSEVSNKAVTTKRTNKSSSIKSVPPALFAHEDLITAFWKTKQGSKSDAGWKLLMTELGKIQDKYGDRVVRDQLELAAANRWKGVSLKNYEQFGLNTFGQPQRRSEADWDAIEAAMPKTPW